MEVDPKTFPPFRPVERGPPPPRQEAFSEIIPISTPSESESPFREILQLTHQELDVDQIETVYRSHINANLLKLQKLLAGIQIEKRFGYIDKQGKTAVRPLFASGTGFSDGYAAVETPSCCGGKWIYLDRRGLMIPNLFFLQAKRFSEGLARP